MNPLAFEYDEYSSLNVIINEGWWFSLENLGQILDVQQTEFIKNTKKSHCRTIDNRPFCDFQECCRRFIRSNKPGSVKATDWFFQTVVPQLRSMETSETYKPITNHLELIEQENQEIQTRINQLEATFSQQLDQLTSEFRQSLKSLAQGSSNLVPPIDVATLREQQQQNNQIVDNFIRSLETVTPSRTFSHLVEIDELFNQDLVHNGNGNGRDSNEIR